MNIQDHRSGLEAIQAFPARALLQSMQLDAKRLEKKDARRSSKCKDTQRIRVPPSEQV